MHADRLNTHLAKRLRGTRHDPAILGEFPDAAARHGLHRYRVTAERLNYGITLYSLWRDDAPDAHLPGITLGATMSEAMDAIDGLDDLDALWERYVDSIVPETPEREWEESVLYRYRTYATWLTNQVSPTEREQYAEPTAANILHAMRHRGYTGPRTVADVASVLDAHDLRGGARIGTGPKPQYGERMRTIQVRLPLSAIERAREAGDGNVSAGLRSMLSLTPVE